MKVCSFCRRCYDDAIVSCTEKDHPVLSETHSGSPEVIGDYRLEFLLESVGKLEIFRARQTASGQACLIKILAADEENSQQFLNDAQISAAFFHANVASVYETGLLSSGEAYVVSETANGQTLRELLNGGAPSLLTAIQVARQTAEALHAVHTNGLMHRAINPANIVLTTGSDQGLLIKIQNLDFGALGERSITNNKFLNESGLYSLRYFAPEQCSGEEVSPQTDVYSLGVVFYEMLAGVPPFDGPTAAALIHRHRNEMPPEIRIANFDLRMLLTHTLTESLQKQPASRQPSAFAFARQMRHIEQLATHSSTPPPAIAMDPQSGVPHKAAAAAVVIAPAKPIKPIAFQAGASGTSTNRVMKISAPIIAAEVEATPVTAQGVKIEPPAPLVIEEQPIAANAEGESAAVEIENKPIAFFRSEKEPVNSLKVDDEPFLPFEAEGAPVLKSETKSEVIAALKSETPVLDLSEIRETTDRSNTEPVTKDAKREDDCPPHRSRLKLLRKKLHAKTQLGAKEITEVPKIFETNYISALASSTVEPVKVQTEPRETSPSPVLSEPAKTESGPPEDGIPQERHILKALSVEQTAATPVTSEMREETPNVLRRCETTKIEWEQPEDDLPSEADVLEVLSREPIAEIPVVQAVQVEIPIIPRRCETTKIEWELPDDDIPSEADVLEVLSKERMGEFSFANVEPEEITVVRSKPIRIEWERPNASPGILPDGGLSTGASNEFAFFPTMIGNRGENSFIDSDRRDPMFSAFYGDPGLQHRALMIGGALIALVGLFVFGSNLVAMYVQTEAGDDRVTIKPVPAQDRQPQTAQTAFIPALKKKDQKNPEKPQPNDEKEIENLLTSQRKDNSPRFSERSQASVSRTSEQNRKAATAVVNKGSRKMLSPPSALVIYTENGVTKSRTEPLYRGTDKKGPAGQERAGYITRPRIVKDPMPK